MSSRYTLEARVVEALIGADAESLITTPRDQLQVTFAGLKGDRHAGLTRFANGRDSSCPRGTEIRNDRHRRPTRCER